MQPEWRGSVVRKSPLTNVGEAGEWMLKTIYKAVEAIHAREVSVRGEQLCGTGRTYTHLEKVATLEMDVAEG